MAGADNICLAIWVLDRLEVPGRGQVLSLPRRSCGWAARCLLVSRGQPTGQAEVSSYHPQALGWTICPHLPTPPWSPSSTSLLRGPAVSVFSSMFLCLWLQTLMSSLMDKHPPRWISLLDTTPSESLSPGHLHWGMRLWAFADAIGSQRTSWLPLPRPAPPAGGRVPPFTDPPAQAGTPGTNTALHPPSPPSLQPAQLFFPLTSLNCPLSSTPPPSLAHLTTAWPCLRRLSQMHLPPGPPPPPHPLTCKGLPQGMGL